MFKRLVSVVLVLACLMLPISMASAQDGVDWKAELGDLSGKTVKVIMIGDPWVGAFEAINAKFTELTGAEVVLESYGYDQTHEKEVLLGTSQSSDFDVIVLDAPWVGEFAEGGFVEDLTPYIEADADIVQFEDFIPSFQEVSKWKNEIIGIPFGAYVVLLHYRTDLFEAAGLQPPTTVEEWKAAAEALTNPDEGIYGAALNNQRGSPVGQAFFEYIFGMGGKPFESMYPGSPDPYADMTPLLDSPEAIATVQLFVDMLPYEPLGAENMAWDERTAAFLSGQVAMLSEWDVRTPGIANPEQSAVVDVFDTTVFPHKEGADPLSPLGGWVMGINSYSEQKDLAWAYIKWFTSPEIHKEFVLAGGPASRLSTQQDPDVIAAQPWTTTAAEAFQNTWADCRPRIPESSEIITTIGNWISKAITGELSVEEAMKGADEEVAQLLKDAGYVVNQ